MTQEKKLKIVFNPGCFDDFTGTQEELDKMVAEINRMAETGELFENSTPLTEESWDLLPEQDKARILAALDQDDEEPRNLQ